MIDRLDLNTVATTPYAAFYVTLVCNMGMHGSQPLDSEVVLKHKPVRVPARSVI